MAGFFEELKRRNVLKVAVAYVVTAWLVIQVMDAALPMLLLPDWIGRAVLFLLILGFPIALILAWAFELTPEGIKRDSEVSAGEPAPRESGRKIDFVIIGLLVIAVGYFAVDKFLLRTGGTDTDIANSGVVSIAVLPFVNMSDNKENEYFADGLAEELLNLLAKRTDLRVAARTSSFQFKNYTGDVQDIGKQLNVDHIVEGSVRRAGGRIRVTAQLVDVNDGFHRWSETYDRELEDIFAVQDEISEAIATALHANLSGSGLASRSTDNLEAYELYLQGRHYWRQRHVAGLERAVDLFESAIQLDPDFARAHEALAETYLVLPWWSGEPVREYFELAAVAGRRALELDDGLAEAWSTLGFVEEMNHDWIEGARLKLHAVSLDPDNATVLQWYGESSYRVGHLEKALSYMQKAHAADPAAPVVNYLLGYVYVIIGDYENALTYFSRADELGIGEDAARNGIAFVYHRMGDTRRAAELYRSSRAPDWLLACVSGGVLPHAAAMGDVAGLGLLEQAVDCLERSGNVDAAFEMRAGTVRERGPAGGIASFWFLGSALVEHPDFPALAEEVGFLAYWQANGFPSNCRPDGDSVRCTAR